MLAEWLLTECAASSCWRHRLGRLLAVVVATLSRAEVEENVNPMLRLLELATAPERSSTQGHSRYIFRKEETGLIFARLLVTVHRLLTILLFFYRPSASKALLGLIFFHSKQIYHSLPLVDTRSYVHIHTNVSIQQ